MTREIFAEKIVLLRKTLYYVSYSMLPNPADQEDAVHECIQKGLQKCHTLKDDRALKAWITRILINECYNLLRKKKREFPAADIPVVTPTLEDTSLFDAISSLDEKLRLPVVLHYIEGYTTKEISNILRSPEGTVKSRLVQARRALRKVLEDQEEIL